MNGVELPAVKHALEAILAILREQLGDSSNGKAPGASLPSTDEHEPVSNSQPESFFDYVPEQPWKAHEGNAPGRSGSAATLLYQKGQQRRNDSNGRRGLRLARAGSHVGWAESLIGEDDRTRVTDPHTYPWRMIASLEIITRSGEAGGGTGFFVGPNLLLTAGHCVYSRAMDGWADRIIVRPGRDGENCPFGEYSSRRFASVATWVREQRPEFDYGVIQLDEPVGEQTGWFGLAVLRETDLQDERVNISGFPGDLTGGRSLWHSTSPIASVDKNRIYYTADTTPGTSGGAAFTSDGSSNDSLGDQVVVAVHTNGTGVGALGTLANSGTRITPQLLRNVEWWRDRGIR